MSKALKNAIAEIYETIELVVEAVKNLNGEPIAAPKTLAVMGYIGEAGNFPVMANAPTDVPAFDVDVPQYFRDWLRDFGQGAVPEPITEFLRQGKLVRMTNREFIVSHPQCMLAMRFRGHMDDDEDIVPNAFLAYKELEKDE